MTVEDLRAEGWTLVHRFSITLLPSEEPDGLLLHWRSPDGTRVLNQVEALRELEATTKEKKA